MIAIAALALFVIGSAQAVHDETFQLDGDVVASTATNYGGHAQSFDWDSFFNSSGASSPTLPDASRLGFSASGFEQDFKQAANGNYDTSDNTTYTQGSKDIDNVGSWVCTPANNVTNRETSRTPTPWRTPRPPWRHPPGTSSSTSPWSGTSTRVMRTSPSGSCRTGARTAMRAAAPRTSPATTLRRPVRRVGVHEGRCRLDDQRLPVERRRERLARHDSGRERRRLHGDDSACTSGRSGLCDSQQGDHLGHPWLTNNNGKSNGTGHSLLTAELFEGGVDLTLSGLAGKCFNTFVADTARRRR